MATTMKSERELLTVAQAARIANVTPDAIRQWDRRGKLAGVVRSPYGRLIPVDQLERTLQIRDRERVTT